MLAVSAVRETTTGKDEIHVQVEEGSGNEEFLDFSDENLLESIDFNDLFVGINERDELPDLEIDPELLAQFSISGTSSYGSDKNICEFNGDVGDETPRDENDRVSGLELGTDSNMVGGGGEDIMSRREESVMVNYPLPKDGDKGRKSSGACVKSNNQGKRKMKVDWTPELHRRFVQAVEQLGVDKAVPSRILEVMGIDCLTRHNIASHLQKYRSHRKHLLAREAASWNQRRQIYGPARAGDGGSKRIMSPWLAPTIGFPPVPNMHHHFRPLHVWGHPPMDKPLMPMWPYKHLSHSPSPTWAPPPTLLPSDPSYWNHHHQLVPNGLTPGTLCFQQPLAPPTRLAVPPVPGIPPHAMYKVESGIGLTNGQSGPHHLLDLHPSKESIDAAIADALSKPWQPLPIGLKPPASTDSVLVELQRQGIPKVPPSCD